MLAVHNHPFDRWTMNDYYSFAAFFTQIGRKEAKTREIIVFNSGRRVYHPVTGRKMGKFLGGATPDCRNKDRHLHYWPIGSPRRTIPTSPPASPTASGLISSVWATSNRSMTTA